MKPRHRVPGLLAAASVLAAAATLLALTIGCGEEPPPSLYTDVYTPGPTPVLTSIQPTSGLAALVEMTLTGQNFIADPAKNIVFFNATPGTILQASTTQLVVRAPLVPGDSVLVRVSAYKSDEFSNSLTVSLEAPVKDFSSFASELPWATAVDAAGNLYVSIQGSDGSARGIDRIDSTGTRTPFATMPATSPIKRFTGMKVGSGGDLYAVSPANAVWRVPAAGGVAAPWTAVSGSTLADLDFDPSGNLWTGGTISRRLYRVRPDRNVKPFPLDMDMRSIRYFSGYLYLGGKSYPDSTERVKRVQVISADSIGPVEEVLDLTASGFAGAFVFAINVDVDGNLYVGTNLTDPILRVPPGGGSAQIFYQGLIKPSTSLLTWGNGTLLYATISTTTGTDVSPTKIVSINTLKRGAPYWGRP